MKIILSALMLLISIYSMGQKRSCEKIIVESYMSFQSYEHFNRLILNTNHPNADFIEDFEFQWSYNYTLKVRVEELAESMSDGKQKNYSLVKEIKKEKVNDSFEFKLFMINEIYPFETEEVNSSFKEINDSTYLYFDKINIKVPVEWKSEFRKILSGEVRKTGHFKFVNEHTIALLKME